MVKSNITNEEIRNLLKIIMLTDLYEDKDVKMYVELISTRLEK
ncbi:hypothetical protein JNUCC83_01410 [Vagococcus sp. JNUCC 83]